MIQPIIMASGGFTFKVIATQTIAWLFSTIAGQTITVDWGDGTSSSYTGTDQVYSKDYGSVGNRVVRIRNKNALTKFRMATVGANISFALAELPRSVTTFVCTGSNTVSGSLSDLPAGLTYFTVQGSNTISGPISGIPVTMKSFTVQGSNTISGSLSDLPAEVTFFNCQGSNTVSGSLVSLPAGVTTFICTGSNTISGSLSDLPVEMTTFICTGSNTVSDYTTKTWTTKPATFDFRPKAGYGLSESEINQLLIDFNDDLVWAAGNAITLTGGNAAPTGLGIDAKNAIIAEGATVTTN